MKILVTGITGYVGSRVAARLAAEGHQLRGLSRRPVELPGVEMLTGDAVCDQGLDRALDGVELAYYLIHSLDTDAFEEVFR